MALCVSRTGRSGDDHCGYDRQGSSGVFVQGRKIKAIARGCRLARNTVREIVRAGETGGATERRYRRRNPAAAAARGICRAARCDAGEANSKRPARAADAACCSRSCWLEGYQGAYDSVQRHVREWRRGSIAAAARSSSRCGSRRARPTSSTGRTRSWCSGWRDGQGRSRPALPQPDVPGARLPAREPGDGVRRARPRLPPVRGGCTARHLRQHGDGGRRGVRRQGARFNRRFCGCARITWSSRPRARRRRAGRRVRSRTRSAMRASTCSRHALRSRLRRAERLAGRALYRPGAGARIPSSDPDDGRAVKTCGRCSRPSEPA